MSMYQNSVDKFYVKRDFARLDKISTETNVDKFCCCRVHPAKLKSRISSETEEITGIDAWSAHKTNRYSIKPECNVGDVLRMKRLRWLTRKKGAELALLMKLILFGK